MPPITKANLEEILKDTNRTPEEVRTKFGPDATRKFVALFEDKMIGGMSLPVGETVDALSGVFSSARDLPRGYALRSEEADAYARGLVSAIIDTAGRFEDHNQMIRFFKGFGNIAVELHRKPEEYFEDPKNPLGPNSLAPKYLYMSKVRDFSLAMLGEKERPEAVVEMVEGLAYYAVKSSKNIRQSMDHIGIAWSKLDFDGIRRDAESFGEIPLRVSDLSPRDRL